MNVATMHAWLAVIGAQVSLTPRSRRLLRRLGLVLLLTLPCIAMATPPAQGSPRAPRATLEGRSGRHWTADYGVRSGACDRAGIGRALGASPQTAATVLGTVVSAAVGAEVGQRMDAADRSCVGHALELVNDGRTVTWSNASSGVTYQITLLPAEPRGDGCRRFRLIAHGSFGLGEGRTVACAGGDGVWRLAPEVALSRR